MRDLFSMEQKVDPSSGYYYESVLLLNALMVDLPAHLFPALEIKRLIHSKFSKGSWLDR